MNQSAQSTRVTPEEIVNFILEEMEAGLSPGYYSNLVPSAFEVYLAPSDFERLAPLSGRIRDEATRALTAKLAALNKAPKLKIPVLSARDAKKRYEALGEWTVEIRENTDDDARDNPLVIVSNFPSSVVVEERAGTMTERVTKRNAQGATSTTQTARTTEFQTRRANGSLYANIEYEDHTGAHTYQMTKDLVKIGRGSIDRWVDLKLASQKDISREHLQIRRDPVSGKFFVKDLSTLGTTVNGKPVPASLERVNGEEIDRNIEVPLPEKAKLDLAGVLTLEFRAVR